MLLVVVLLAGSGLAGARVANTLTVDIPLPPPNSAAASLLTIKGAGPLRVSALNQAQLGSGKVNTQVIAVIGPKTGGTYTVRVFIHRFSAVPRRRLAEAAGGALEAKIEVEGGSPQDFVQLVRNVLAWGRDCTGLRKSGYFGDSIWGKQIMANLVKAMDSPPEEQLDNTINNLCPGAEADDPGQS